MARNELARRFLVEEAFEKLMFVDTDIVFTEEQFSRITSHEVPVAAGVYTLRSKDGYAAFVPVPEKWPVPTEPGLWRVKRAATGFMCIHRNVFKAIVEKHGNRLYDKEGMITYDFFPACLSATHEYRSDDYGFCDLATEADVPIYVDTGVSVGHKGFMTYQAVIEHGAAKQ